MLSLLVPELRHLAYLAKELNIDDTSITASSQLTENHSAKRVRLNRYCDYACAWTAAADDTAPWVQFDMGRNVTAWGVIVKLQMKERNKPKTSDLLDRPHVTSLKVASSKDGENWIGVSGVITTDYTRMLIWLPSLGLRKLIRRSTGD